MVFIVSYLQSNEFMLILFQRDLKLGEISINSKITVKLVNSKYSVTLKKPLVSDL